MLSGQGWLTISLVRNTADLFVEYSVPNSKCETDLKRKRGKTYKRYLLVCEKLKENVATHLAAILVAQLQKHTNIMKR